LPKGAHILRTPAQNQGAGLIVVLGLLVVGLLIAVFFPRLFASKETPA
jgi:Tfp pilus assembly protein PilX